MTGHQAVAKQDFGHHFRGDAGALHGGADGGTAQVVRSQAGGVLQLMAGAGSGLRPGDRLLIMQPGWVPSRMLDPRAADHIALAIALLFERFTSVSLSQGLSDEAAITTLSTIWKKTLYGNTEEN